MAKAVKCFLILLFASWWGIASANVIEAIDIARSNGHALITIRFSTEIQYLRHVPSEEGKFLRIFFRVVKPGFVENEIMQENLKSPPSDLVPRFTVTYPELTSGMLVSFARSTRFTVAPGGDSRSIVVMVPVAAEQAKSAPSAVPKPAAGDEGSSATPGKLPAASAAAEAGGSAAAVVPPRPEDANGERAKPAMQQVPDAEKPAEAVPLTPEQVERLAGDFLAAAREAFAAGNHATAINRLNRILGLPPNSRTEAAQALLGEVREKNGEYAKARAEYQLYLKLYPKGSEAKRIEQHLAVLPQADQIRRPREKTPKDAAPAEWLVYGGLSSYYFTGRSKQDSGPWKRDQESLVSSLNFNARLRDGATDTRIVFRDTDSQNFLQDNRNYNRIYSAYAERTDRDAGYFIRVGRQNPNGGGVLERFDGLNLGYNLNSEWRLNAVGGSAVEFLQRGFSGFNTPQNKKFYGTSVEYLPQLGRPGGSLYAVEQTLDGYLNRRAVGSEFRYFDGQFNGFGVVDYDVLYKGLNIAALQGNYLDAWGNNYFVSYDYRMSPTYSLSNALASTSTLGITSVPDLVNHFGLGQSRQLVTESTPAMTMFGAGVTIPVGERWQFGLDYRGSKVSGTNAVLSLNQVCKSLGFNALDPNDPICVGGPLGDTPVSQLCAGTSFDPTNNTCQAGQLAQGQTDTYTVQAVGTNLLVKGGVGIASASFNKGTDFSGQNYGLNYIFPIREDWRLEGNIRYTTFRSDNGNGQSNLTPSLRLGYQQRSGLYLETEVGYSDQKTTGSNAGQNRREYIYMGMRWDFR